MQQVGVDHAKVLQGTRERLLNLGGDVGIRSIGQAMILAMTEGEFRLQFDTVKVEGKKCPLRGKELRDLAVAAWYEALGLPAPSAEDLDKQAEQAQSKS